MKNSLMKQNTTENCNFGIKVYYFRKWKSCDMDLHFIYGGNNYEI